MTACRICRWFIGLWTWWLAIGIDRMRENVVIV